jgi:hypothetical protein
MAAPLWAQDRTTLGVGRLFVNDGIGDGNDRWRTGAYTVSLVRGSDWRGAPPQRFGDILEYRFRAEIVAPANITRPSRRDRRYAGILSIGAHTHVGLGAAEARLGFDLIGTGPATGLGRFQSLVHDIFGLPDPNLSNQIGNALHPTVSGEFARSFALGEARVRPFVEGQAGLESYLRAGADVTWGRFGAGALMLRDTTTGQLYQGIRGGDAPGFSFTFGGDVARMFDSALLPAGGPALREDRHRLRLGVNWQGERSEVFYGLTHLGREFEGQRDGQVVGSIRLRLRF